MPIRNGFRTLTPYPIVQNVPGMVEFMKQVFGAEETFRAVGSAGGYHGEIRVGDSMMMIGGGGPDVSWCGESHPMAFHIYVPDVDSTYLRALAAGAVSLQAPTNQPWGERTANVKDPSGNNWYIATFQGHNYFSEGAPTIQPYLHPAESGPVIDFVARAFGGVEEGRAVSEDGAVLHSTVKIGDAAMEFSDAEGIYQTMPGMFYLYVPDVDAVYRRALEAGATSVSEPTDQAYGDRVGGGEGCVWQYVVCGYMYGGGRGGLGGAIAILPLRGLCESSAMTNAKRGNDDRCIDTRTVGSALSGKRVPPCQRCLIAIVPVSFLEAIDYEQQLIAFSGLLRRNKAADAQLENERKEIIEYIRNSTVEEQLDAIDQSGENFYAIVYQGAAHSVAALGMIAPLVESMFYHGFQGIRKRHVGMRVVPGGYARSMPGNVEKFSDCRCFFNASSGKFGKNLVPGTDQFAEAVGLAENLPSDLHETLDALFSYGNQMFHNGLEWPEPECQKFARHIKQEGWERWFHAATRSDEPWIFYMTEEFIAHCVVTVGRVIESFGAFAKSHDAIQMVPSMKRRDCRRVSSQHTHPGRFR